MFGSATDLPQGSTVSVKGARRRTGGDDAALDEAVAAAKQGRWAAVDYLYARYATRVYATILRIVRDPHEAEDITHNVFAKLITTIRGYERRKVPFAAWLLRVARNAALDHLRLHRQDPCEPSRLRTGSQEEVSNERLRTLRLALEELPVDQRRVVVMRHVIGLSPVEIAGHLGKTEAAVHGLHHRGRHALEDILREQGSAPVVLATN